MGGGSGRGIESPKKVDEALFLHDGSKLNHIEEKIYLPMFCTPVTILGPVVIKVGLEMALG